MESERFEALIDAILAIIITIIVMEIPLPQTTTLHSLLELTPEFLAYALSFVLCFNVWNFHHNMFNVVNKIDSSITWASGISIMIVGLLPHVSTMVVTDFNSFIAQFMFGLVFFLTHVNFYVVDLLLVRFDKANIALRLLIEERKNLTIIITVMYLLSFVIGYLIYPPVIVAVSVLSVAINLLPKNKRCKLKIPI